MLVAFLILLPACAAALAFRMRQAEPRRIVLILAAALHLVGTLGLWSRRPTGSEVPPDRWFAVEAFSGRIVTAADHGSAWFGLDAAGLVALTLTSILFLAASIYAAEYLRREKHEINRTDFQEGGTFVNEPENVFVACLLLLLSTMTAVCTAQHLGLFWVAVEGTTLAGAPLIYFHRHHRSLEAAWKYLLLCSVGIALALLGNFFLAKSIPPDGHEHGLLLGSLLANGKRLDPQWLLTAQIFLLVGYGTKVGLAPLHNWLPDVYSEAPSLVALLSGALANCVFLGILRSHAICSAAGLAEPSRNLLIGFGLVSMLTAAIFLVGRQDFKRMLGYSSVEHMGILTLAVGIGAGFAVPLHTVCHSFTKAALFLTAGNLTAIYRSKSPAVAQGIGRTHPMLGALWLLGFLSIVGTPPFGTFLSEFSILRTALADGRYAVAIAYSALLFLIFLAMARTVLPMLHGAVPEPIAGAGAEEAVRPEPPPPAFSGMCLVPAILLVGALVLGLYVPEPVRQVFEQAACAMNEGPAR